MNVTTKFNVGERAYYVIFATSSVNSVDIVKVYSFGGDIFYNLRKSGTGLIIDRVLERDVLNFTEARLRLIEYLTRKLDEATKLVAP